MRVKDLRARASSLSEKVFGLSWVFGPSWKTVAGKWQSASEGWKEAAEAWEESAKYWYQSYRDMVMVHDEKSSNEGN